MDYKHAITSYAVGVSAALAFVVLVGAAGTGGSQDEITVRKIRVLEPDGTVRMVISGTEEAPGLHFHNTEHPHPSGQRPAGLYFMNDEGTEVGGLIFSGSQRDSGQPFSMVHFSMDNYDQDQALVLRHIQDQGIETALMVNDVPLVPKDPARLAPLATLDGAAREDLLAELRATGMFDSRMRMFAGRSRDGDALLTLHDAGGSPRLVLRVGADGETQIQVLDARGELVKDLIPGLGSDAD